MLTPMRLRNAPSAHGYGVPRVSAAKETWLVYDASRVVCWTAYSAGAECVAGSRILPSGTVRDSTPLLRPSPRRPLMTNAHGTVKNFCCSG